MKPFRAITSWLAVTAGSLLIAAAFNILLIPQQLLSGGLSGISMMIGYLTGSNIGWLYMALNIPVLIWGWFTLGRRFVGWSAYSVAAATLFMQLIPATPLAQDILLSSVFGGILLGFGTGLCLRAGGSSGGFDIVASIVSRSRDLPVGMLIFVLNGLVIGILVFFTNNWDIALYSLISIFTAGKVVDLIHIRHLKVTVFIITQKTDELLARMLARPRGVTIIKTQGAFTHRENDMLMTVTTRYELEELKLMIRKLDPKAFVNIVETVGVVGDFRRNSS
ncbi:YitT family protein [Paenibacillus pasadenensis]|uniref:YitT family protein n=1 Tax=Paenibacillus pasadenensis TaxID=217090 RepID=UPI00203E15A7|nr:YitT family protein [Paenibacillus pasadenensis]MCM3747138.1 YitT family protein [Paenibacillus pasadenensis]